MKYKIILSFGECEHDGDSGDIQDSISMNGGEEIDSTINFEEETYNSIAIFEGTREEVEASLTDIQNEVCLWSNSIIEEY